MVTSMVRFYDPTTVSSVSGLHLTPVPVEKVGVIMDREGPSDLGGVSVFAGSVQTLADNSFRMYYYSHGSREGQRVMRIALAESEDGFLWRRPMLGQLTWKGKDTNHLRIHGLPEDANITQPSVVRLADGSWRMYFWLHAQRNGMIRYLIADSPDGLFWQLHDLNRPAVFHPADLEVGQAGWVAGLTEADPASALDSRRTWPFLAAKRLRSNDATNVYYDETRGCFEMLSVWLLPNPPDKGRQTPHDNAPSVLRVIHRRTSEDGLNFSDPELIILPDEGDPITQQFYYLSQHRDRDWRIGFLGNYPCWEQTMDIEMCFSRDGRTWLRPFRNGFIPRDPVPQRGCMSAYATNNLLPISRSRWLMLYRAGNTLHNGELGPGVAGDPWYGIMGAVWPRGRFAGLKTTANARGRLLLAARVQTAEMITVNATVNGWLKAELRDPLGGRIPGFGFHESIPVSGDGDHLTLHWGSEHYDSARFRYDAVQLYLEVADGTVYGIDC